MTDRRVALTILIFVLFTAVAVGLFERPPAAKAADTPASEFSAERALGHLREFAKLPHPIGSAEHERVRDYLIAQLASVGLTPEVQSTIGVVPRYQVAGAVENIAARLKGSGADRRAVALLAHYDSVPAGPGAGDDGAGVAAILETVRALRTGPPLQNDLIVLFSDGEEEGLLGAAAFVDQHPWFKDVRVVINLEARGNSGDSQLFETSEGNGRLVETFARSTPHPSGTSLTYEIYKHMPNDTDLTVFRKAGTAALNFAFIGHWEAYHTPLDNPAALNPASLQHHGENALTLARVFGNADLSQLQQRDDVFFALPRGIFLRYSSAWAWPLAGLAAICWLALAAYASGSWGVQLSSILFGLLAGLGLLAVAALLAAVVHALIFWLHEHRFPEGSLLESLPYLFFIFALLFALYGFAWPWLRRRLHPAAVALGFALLLLLGEAALARWMPGATFVLVWPLLALFVAGNFAFRDKPFSLVRVVATCILSIPALLLFLPLLKGFFQALGFTQIGTPMLAVTFAVLLMLLAPLLDVLLVSAGVLVPALSLVLAAALFVWGAETTRYSSEHPKPSMMTYALDANKGEAEWASSAERVDAWTAQFVGQNPTRARLTQFFPDWIPLEFSKAPAAPANLPPPKAELIGSSQDANSRTLQLRISSPRRASTISIYVPEAQVLEASVNGHVAGLASQSRWARSGQWRLDFANACSPVLGASGIELSLKIQGTAAMQLVLVDRSSGLPAVPGLHPPPRPADSMPQHLGDSTMVRSAFVF